MSDTLKLPNGDTLQIPDGLTPAQVTEYGRKAWASVQQQLKADKGQAAAARPAPNRPAPQKTAAPQDAFESMPPMQRLQFRALLLSPQFHQADPSRQKSLAMEFLYRDPAFAKLPDKVQGHRVRALWQWLDERQQRIAQQGPAPQHEILSLDAAAKKYLARTAQQFRPPSNPLSAGFQFLDRTAADLIRGNALFNPQGRPQNLAEALQYHQARLPFAQRLKTQDPRGLAFNALPWLGSVLQHDPHGGLPALLAGVTEKGAGLVGSENAAILATMAIGGELGIPGAIAKKLAEGGFGVQGAAMIKSGLARYAKTKNVDDLADAIVGAAVTAGAAHSALKPIVADVRARYVDYRGTRAYQRLRQLSDAGADTTEAQKAFRRYASAPKGSAHQPARLSRFEQAVKKAAQEHVRATRQQEAGQTPRPRTLGEAPRRGGARQSSAGQQTPPEAGTVVRPAPEVAQALQETETPHPPIHGSGKGAKTTTPAKPARRGATRPAGEAKGKQAASILPQPQTSIPTEKLTPEDIGDRPKEEIDAAERREKAAQRGQAATAPARPTLPDATHTHVPGSRGKAFTPGNTEIGYRWAVVSADELIPSHTDSMQPNPRYDPALQPRDRTRIASEAQVSGIATNLNPHRLGDSSSTSEGAPIIGPDNQVESGNGRSLAIRRAYQQGGEAADRYRSWLTENAQAFGLDPAQLRTVRNPVLVRVREGELTPQARAHLADEMGRSPVGAMSEPETAKNDARRLTETGMIGQFVPGEVTSLANREFVRAFVKDVVGPEGQAGMVQPDGTLSAAGVRRVRNALFAAAYEDTTTLSRLTESTDDNTRNVGQAMLQVAPKMAQLRQGVAAGRLYPLDITGDITSAVNTLSHLRDTGRTVDEHLAQQAMFGSGETPEAQEILRYLENHKRSGKRIAALFHAYADAVSALGDPHQGALFADTKVTPTKLEVLRAAQKVIDYEAQQTGLDFGAAEGPTASAGSPAGGGPDRGGDPPVPKTAAGETGKTPGLSNRPGTGRGPDRVAEGTPAKPKRPASRLPKPKPGSHTGAVLSDIFTPHPDTAAAIREMGYAARNTFGRNLAQLEDVGKRTGRLNPLRAARQHAGATAQARLLLSRTLPAIEQAYGKPPSDFFPILAESRLRGARQRWHDLATAVTRATPQEFTKSAKGWLGLLSTIEGARRFDGTNFPRDLTRQASTLLSNKDMDGLRLLLADTFAQARDNVGAITGYEKAGAFEKATADPKFQAALKIYKDVLEKELARSHAENEGVFSTALGPLDTYFPLTPTDLEGNAIRTRTGAARNPFARPTNPANKFTTGLAAKYDLTTQTFADKVERAFFTNSRGRLYRALHEAGFVKILKRGAPRPEDLTVKIAGEEFPAKVYTYDPGRTIMKDGRSVYTRAQEVLVPEWLAAELDPMLEHGRWHDTNAIGRVVNKINTLGLLGPFDAVWHTANLNGSLIAGTPFVGSSIAARTVGNTPLTKIFNTWWQVMKTDPTAPEAAEDIAHLARLGLLPEKTGRTTYSRDYAARTGAELRRTFEPFLYGPRGVDLRARLVMYRTAKAMFAEGEGRQPTDEELFDFISQLGNYTWGLTSSLERAAKKSGIAPFITAGKTQLGVGARAMVGRTPLPGAGLSTPRRVGYRLMQQLSGGAVGVVAAWMTAHKLYTGHWPGQDKGDQFLKVKLSDSARASGLAQSLFGQGDNPVYVDFSFLSPTVARGAQVAGVKGYVDAWAQGKTPGEAIENGYRVSLNSLLHPLTSGPATHAAILTATGAEPYIQRLRDVRGEFHPELRSAVGKTTPGLATAAAQVREGALSVNPLIRQTFAWLGIGDSAERLEGKTTGQKVLRSLIDIAAPRLLYEQPPRKEKAGHSRGSSGIPKRIGQAEPSALEVLAALVSKKG